MKINFKSFASIVFGMFIIGISVGFIIGYYIHGVSQTYIWMYLAAPCLGLGSSLIVYGTLFGRKIN